MISKELKQKSAFFINIVLPSAFAVVLFIASLFYLVIPAFENNMMDRKREMIKELTNAATSILDKYYKDEADSLISRAEAQQTAISRIQYLRYGDENKDYFWITDMAPVMIMHPYRPDLNGQSLAEFKDSHGKKLFVEAVQVARENGHGYIDYMWQWKDDSTHIVPKLSYVKAFKPWGWIVGTGIYIEDVKKEIKALTAKFTRISIFISLITALILFYVGRQSLRIERKRRKAELELNESKEKYKSLVEASTEGLMMVINGRITFSNTVLQDMLLYKADELLEKEFSAIVTLPAALIKEINEAPQTVHQDALETVLLKKNGQKLNVLLNISPIVFYENQALIFTVKDVSRDKKIEEELFQSKEKFKTLMDKLNLGIFRTTLDLKGRFLEANETALNILGFKNFGELSQYYILDLFIDIEDKKTFRQVLLEKGFVKNQVIKLRRKSGQIAVVTVSLVVVGKEDATKFCDGIIEDVSHLNYRSNEPNDMLDSYVSFTQLYYQPVKNLARTPVLCRMDEAIENIPLKMTAANVSAVFITTGENDIAGVVTDSDIRARWAANKEAGNTRAYEIMTSPVIFARDDIFLFEALNILRKHHIRNLLLKDMAGKCTGYVSREMLAVVQDFLPVNFTATVENTFSVEGLKTLRATYVNAILPLIENGVKPYIVSQSLSVLSDAMTRRIIDTVVKEMGEPPAVFCFFSLGSDARKEQTLSTDQDNALIFEDVAKEQEAGVLKYFNAFSLKVCTALNEIGYNFCKGNVMAMNPEWCMSLKDWKAKFGKWINKGNAKDLLDINIFFDIRPVYGEAVLTEALVEYIFEASAANPAYLFHLTQNTLSLKPQVGFWGNILLETAGAPPETVNIKETLMPIVNFARIYALKQRCSEAGTMQRLNCIYKDNVLNPSTYTNILQAFEYLNQVRLRHQADLYRNSLKPDNLINTNMLSELDKTIIKKVLSNISSMLAKLSYDFKGTL